VARDLSLVAGTTPLRGTLRLPPGALGLVLFAHGSGSSRLSPRNNYVAEQLAMHSLASLMFDLLTAEEEHVDAMTRKLRFDISLLTERLVGATSWAQRHPQLQELAIGYFGASTGAAAALTAAARVPQIRAIVSRGGRPDLAGRALAHVGAPTLLIVGESDPEVLELNRWALSQMVCQAKLEIVPHATHLFSEPGALDQVALLASRWFVLHLSGSLPPP
jgi:dienelactone hydrolase